MSERATNKRRLADTETEIVRVKMQVKAIERDGLSAPRALTDELSRLKLAAVAYRKLLNMESTR